MQPTPDFNPKTAAKKLLREGRSGALATLLPGSGDPYCSLVNVATAADGAPLLLISKLAIHTKNVLADPRVSLMIDERKEGDPLQGGRIMMMGTASVTNDPDARRRYLDRQPEAEGFASFADFSFYQIALKAVHLVAGFGRIVDLLVLRGEENHRHVGLLTQAAQRLHAVHARHLDVEDRKVRRTALESVKRGRTIRVGHDAVALRLERNRNGGQNVAVVVDESDGRHENPLSDGSPKDLESPQS